MTSTGLTVLSLICQHRSQHVYRNWLECLQVIQDALHQFKGTPEEVQVTVANAELAVQRGDLPAAISELRWVLRWSVLPSPGLARVIRPEPYCLGIAPMRTAQYGPMPVTVPPAACAGRSPRSPHSS